MWIVVHTGSQNYYAMFLVNYGEATSKEIHELTLAIQESVKAKDTSLFDLVVKTISFTDHITQQYQKLLVRRWYRYQDPFFVRCDTFSDMYFSARYEEYWKYL